MISAVGTATGSPTERLSEVQDRVEGLKGGWKHEPDLARKVRSQAMGGTGGTRYRPRPPLDRVWLVQER